MTSITIDNIDDDLMRRLREQAERTGNSVADEAKSLLNLIVAYSGEKPDQDDVYSKYFDDLLNKGDWPSSSYDHLVLDLDLVLIAEELGEMLDRYPGQVISDLIRHKFHGVGFEFEVPPKVPTINIDLVHAINDLAKRRGITEGEVASDLIRYALKELSGSKKPPHPEPTHKQQSFG